MNSHAHLVIQTPDDDKKTISAIMHDIDSLYARDYNKRHSRTGHVWGERTPRGGSSPRCYQSACSSWPRRGLGQ